MQAWLGVRGRADTTKRFGARRCAPREVRVAESSMHSHALCGEGVVWREVVSCDADGVWAVWARGGSAAGGCARSRRAQPALRAHACTSSGAAQHAKGLWGRRQHSCARVWLGARASRCFGWVRGLWPGTGCFLRTRAVFFPQRHADGAVAACSTRLCCMRTPEPVPRAVFFWRCSAHSGRGAFCAAADLHEAFGRAHRPGHSKPRPAPPPPSA
jgi:hypothetical protein